LVSILEELDQLNSLDITNGSVEKLKALCCRFQMLDQEYILWFKELSAMAESIDSWRLFLTKWSSRPQPEKLTFPDLRLAHLMLCFWTLRSLEIQAIASFHKLRFKVQSESRVGVFQTEDAPQSTLTGPYGEGILSRNLVYVDSILQAVQYCMGEEMGLASCLRCVFGLCTSLDILLLSTQHSEMLERCRVLLAQSAERGGVTFAKGIADESGK